MVVYSHVTELLAIQGPNYIWHMDAYEKLVTYGITIHGCIDGLVP